MEVGGEIKMSDKEVTEEAINDKLNEIMEAVDEKIDETLPQIIRLLAKLLFNVRFDLNEFKLEIVEFMKKLKIESEGNIEPEELKYSKNDLKKVGDNLEEHLRDPCRYS